MNRVSSRKRITIALVGLIVLVVVGWFVQQRSADPSAPAGMSRPAVSSPVPVSYDSWPIRSSSGSAFEVVRARGLPVPGGGPWG